MTWTALWSNFSILHLPAKITLIGIFQYHFYSDLRSMYRFLYAAHEWQWKLYQLLQVLLGEPRVPVALLLELVARRLGHHGHFLRLEPATGPRRATAARRCRGVQEPRLIPAEDEAAADTWTSSEQQLQRRSPTHVLQWPCCPGHRETMDVQPKVIVIYSCLLSRVPTPSRSRCYVDQRKQLRLEFNKSSFLLSSKKTWIGFVGIQFRSNSNKTGRMWGAGTCHVNANSSF